MSRTTPGSGSPAALLALLAAALAGEAQNTIGKSDFNFGHQLGYQYARFEDARFSPTGTWCFETGFFSHYTRRMPLVRNPQHYERLMLTIPLYLQYALADHVSLQIELTDLFIEVYDYRRTHDVSYMGGKSPRVKTRIRLLAETRLLPATALTLGVKWSSAKPYTIWNGQHNYDSSNGLAGAGTGEADYLILLSFSKHLHKMLAMHARIGLAPLGSPVEYTRGSGQADQIPYGLALEVPQLGSWRLRAEVAGMYNGLKSTTLAHYCVLRGYVSRSWRSSSTALMADIGLSPESDDWILGLQQRFFWHRRSKAVIP